MAHHRHKRETNARRIFGARLPQLPSLRPAFLAAPLAVVATAGVVSIGVVSAGVSTVGIAAPVTDPAAASVSASVSALPRSSTLSRGLTGGRTVDPTSPSPSAEPSAKSGKVEVEAPTRLERLLAPAAVSKAIAAADTKLWTTESLNLWTSPAESARQTGTIDAGEPVVVTGRELGDRVEIVFEKTRTRWVTAGYLSDEEPAQLGDLDAACTNGTTVPDGVSENIKKVHSAVCAAFPDITTYGTFRGDGEHSQGIAVDIMVSGEEGTRIADFVRENAAALGVNYVIWQQQIWSVERGGEGWRGMEDRGSVTDNHFDHVHVTVF